MEHDPSVPPPHHHPHHPHPHPHHHHPHHHHQQPQAAPPQGMMIPPGNSYHPHHHHHPHHLQHSNFSNAPPQMIGPNSAALFQSNRLPFNSPVTASSKPLEPLNSAFSGDGSSGLRPNTGSDGGGAGGSGGFSVDTSNKKKRGRPRKYSPDGGNIALGLAPTPISAPSLQGDSSGGTPSSGAQMSKKHRGRPPGSGKKQLDALGNCGVGFTPHVILVNAGEDVAKKIVSFSQQGPRTVCILSAYGSIRNMKLCHSSSNGPVSYEGSFEIISLTGSFLLTESGGSQVTTAGLSISLAGPDGRVMGGEVAGDLIAADQVQIIVGSFIANGKKPKYMPSVPESRVLHFGTPSAAGSPVSQEEPSSESSEENGNGALQHRGAAASGPYNHSGQAQQQQIHNMQQMYPPMGWPNSGGSAKMLHH